jgi:hypothetical protein
MLRAAANGLREFDSTIRRRKNSDWCCRGVDLWTIIYPRANSYDSKVDGVGIGELVTFVSAKHLSGVGMGFFRVVGCNSALWKRRTVLQVKIVSLYLKRHSQDFFPNKIHPLEKIALQALNGTMNRVSSLSVDLSINTTPK